MTDSPRLDGQVAVVTGRGDGLALACARVLAAAGAAVAVMGRSGAEVAALVAVVARASGQALAFAGDVTDAAALGRFVALVEQRLGPIDLLVHDGAAGDPGPGCRAMLPAMRARGHGRVVLLGIAPAALPGDLAAEAGPGVAFSAIPPGDLPERTAARVLALATGAREPVD